MTPTYRAMQISRTGHLQLVERPLPQPEPGQVLIAVEACGICGADRGDIESADPVAQRVPRHEVVGRIVAIGGHVPEIWQKGQRVGVGRFGGPCLDCSACRNGRLHLGRNQPVTGSSRDGGYAEMMTARATGLLSIPDELSFEEAAPILCAGIATFNGLKASGAEPGDTVAVLGIGAHRYIDTDRENATDALTSMSGAAAILTHHHRRFRGRLVAHAGPCARRPARPCWHRNGLAGDFDRTDRRRRTWHCRLDHRIALRERADAERPWIETLPLERAEEAYQRMRSGTAKFRMVLTMKGAPHAYQ